MDLHAALLAAQPGSRPATLVSNERTLELLHHALHGTRTMHSLAWLKDGKAVLGAIDARKLSDSTRSRYLSTILVALRAMEGDAARARKVYKAIERQRDAIEAVSAKRRASRIKTAREEANWVAADELRAVVDTTGAGDLYAAGVLFGLSRGATPDHAARLGSIAAAEVISHLGARPKMDLVAVAKSILG